MKYKIHQLDVLGLEGFYAAGMAALTCVGLLFVSGPRAGSLDNINDAFQQMLASRTLMGIMVGFALNAAVFVGTSITITKYMNATARVVIENLRTVSIWVVSLLRTSGPSKGEERRLYFSKTELQKLPLLA